MPTIPFWFALVVEGSGDKGSAVLSSLDLYSKPFSLSPRDLLQAPKPASPLPSCQLMPPYKRPLSQRASTISLPLRFLNHGCSATPGTLS